ncbi:MAG: hypothetical protein ABEI52_05485, partial [Halobacteriaceae archaeon]
GMDAGKQHVNGGSINAAKLDGERSSASNLDIDGYVAPSLQDSEGTKTVIVQLKRPDIRATASTSEVRQLLKDHADETQDAVENFASNHEAVTIEAQFWITNAVVVKINT